MTSVGFFGSLANSCTRLPLQLANITRLHRLAYCTKLLKVSGQQQHNNNMEGSRNLLVVLFVVCCAAFCSHAADAELVYEGCWTNAVNYTRALAFLAADNSYVTPELCKYVHDLHPATPTGWLSVYTPGMSVKACAGYKHLAADVTQQNATQQRLHTTASSV